MWLQIIPESINHETLALILVLGFLLLAGLCLSARAFTQLLEYLASRGYKAEAQKPDAQPRQTGSSPATAPDTKSAPTTQDHITPGGPDTK